jgi:crotonobetainyl-CoA:carnitine CoA-transferase CaiB-like acyl-CoA transferase
MRRIRVMIGHGSSGPWAAHLPLCNLKPAQQPIAKNSRVGEDNDDVHGELLGMSAQEIKALVDEGVI